MKKKVLAITDIIETNERTIRVVLAATNKPCWLPRRLAEFYPGRVVLPQWLADRVLIPGRKEKNYENIG
jgi:hypothetical protein